MCTAIPNGPHGSGMLGANSRKWPSRAALTGGDAWCAPQHVRFPRRRCRGIFWTAVSFIFVVMPSSQTMTYVAGFVASMLDDAVVVARAGKLLVPLLCRPALEGRLLLGRSGDVRPLRRRRRPACRVAGDAAAALALLLRRRRRGGLGGLGGGLARRQPRCVRSSARRARAARARKRWGRRGLRNEIHRLAGPGPPGPSTAPAPLRSRWFSASRRATSALNFATSSGESDSSSSGSSSGSPGRSTTALRVRAGARRPARRWGRRVPSTASSHPTRPRRWLWRAPSSSARPG